MIKLLSIVTKISVGEAAINYGCTKTEVVKLPYIPADMITFSVGFQKRLALDKNFRLPGI